METAMSTATNVEVLIFASDTGICEAYPASALGAGQTFTNGRDARRRFAGDLDRVTVRVTGRGHWYRRDDVHDGLHNDIICRGCGQHGHYDYILDYTPCANPATVEDVIATFNGPARAFQPGDQVRGHQADLGGHFTATVARIYREDGTEVADIEPPNGTPATRVTASSLSRLF
jgi:hypothetical protein